jgi:3-deoxy-D-manno-octulosonic-acid transferase
MHHWKFFYNLFVVPLLWITFHIGKFLNQKIRLGIEGRTNLFADLEKSLKQLPRSKLLWFHASSLGEFEQAKPIISAIRKSYPNINIAATFFSPSGFEHSKNYKLANIITYIPFDSISNAKRFINLVQPRVAIMVRYDIWPNFIWELGKNKIPIFIANATMKQNTLRKLPLIKQFHKTVYNCFSHILTVSINDYNSFKEFGISKPIISAIGDTRFDQVMARSADAQNKHLLSDSILKDKQIFIVGQCWEEDEDVILPVLFKLQEQEHHLLTIIVPHEPTLEHLEQLEYALENKTSFIRFSEMNNYQNEKVILIDSVGVLVALYKYAHYVYIGGSFRQGIHNVLEPAVFGVPVIYGPKHTNSQEAVELAKRGGGFVVTNETELFNVMKQLFENSALRIQAGVIAEAFVREHCGATDRFFNYLEPYLN